MLCSARTTGLWLVLTPPCRQSTHSLMMPVRLLKLQPYMWLRTRVPESMCCGPCTRNCSSLNLAVASLTLLLVCAILRSLLLSMRLLMMSRSFGPVRAVLAWWSRLCSWVTSLLRSNGPAMQLLLFVARFRTWLLMVLPVARKTIGMLGRLAWTWCTILRLLKLGSTTLSMTVLGCDLWVVRMVARLERVAIML